MEGLDRADSTGQAFLPAPPGTVQEHQGAIVRVLNAIPNLERHNVDTIIHHFNMAVDKSFQAGQRTPNGS